MKKVLLLLCIIIPALLTTNCKKGDMPFPGNKDTTHIPEVPKEGILIKTSVFGRIVDEKNAPLSGVTVSGGGTTTTTDANGIYMLTDVMLDQARAYVTATFPGYFKGSRIFQPV